MPKLVLADLDRTLVLTTRRTHSVTDRMKYAAKLVCGVDINVDFSLEGLTDRLALKRALEAVGATNIDFNRCFMEMLHYYILEFFKGIKFKRCPGVKKFFRFCRKNGIHVGLVTGTLQGIAHFKMTCAGLGNHIRPLISAYGDDPHEDRYELMQLAIKKAQREIGFDPNSDQVFVIGDTPLDIEAGHKVNAITIAVATGKFDKAQLGLHSPSLVVKNLRAERQKVFDLLLS